MRVAEFIIHLDTMRKLYRESYDTWKANQKLGRDREWGIYCKEQADSDWEKYLDYRATLTFLGIYTDGQHDWKSDIERYNNLRERMR